MHSTVVVLPAPLAPIRPTISPAGTSRSSPSTTILVPYDLRRPRTVTTCGSLMAPMWRFRPGRRVRPRVEPRLHPRVETSRLVEEAGLEAGLGDARLHPVRARARPVREQLGELVVGEVRRRAVVAGDAGRKRPVRDQPVVQRPPPRLVIGVRAVAPREQPG